MMPAMLNFERFFPLQDPVIVFFTICLIILFVPLLFERIKLPGLVGFIIVGAVLGGNGLHILERNSAITLFGTVGLLYIMFASGLETDIDDFKKNRTKSMVFGVLTFMIPQLFGTLISYYLLKFPMKSSILLASMFASHTLLAYPIVSKLNISKNEAINITVGGTIITNFLSLLILSIITGSERGTLNTLFWIKLTLSTALFLLVTLLLIPKMCRWFFRKLDSGDGSQFIFVLAVLFGVSLLAQLAGIEPIIGAFFAGLVLSNLISPVSPLAEKLAFTGNSLFIPFFLISVGMLINVRSLGSSFTSWIVAVTMVVTATVCKYVPAMITKKMFRYTKAEGDIIFGLSNAQAAATLAAVMVGHQMQLLNDDVLNGTILMIIVTVFISSYVTDRAGRKIAMVMKEKDSSRRFYYSYLINVFNPKTAEKLIDLALLFSNDKANMYALSIVNDDKETNEKMEVVKGIHDQIRKYTVQINKTIESIIRVDINVAGGIIRASKELNVDNVVIGWTNRVSATDRLFGSLPKQILNNFHRRVMICNVRNLPERLAGISVFFPNNIEMECNFTELYYGILNIGRKRKISVHIYCSGETHKQLISLEPPENITLITGETTAERLNLIADGINADKLIVVVASRRNSISWSKENEKIPGFLARKFHQYNFVLIYPEVVSEIENVNII